MGLFWAMRIVRVSYRNVFTGGRAVGCVSARCPTTVARMSTSASIEPDRWEEVLDHLSSMISGKRRADGATWRDAHENMPVYLQRLGIDEEVQKLNVIHVAGTKGKGSTCAMIDSILRASGYSTGLFTSPHLCDVRERIRINGQMVSRPVFADAFWKCYNTLKATATPDAGMPGYFRFLTLLSLEVFLQAKPDVVILEVGIGGRIDATNIIKHTAVTGITSLGYDHMELLGDTLDLIAREKAGIMRKGVPCFTVQQPPEAMAALEACAVEVGADLQVAPSLSHFSHPTPGHTISVGLAGEHQVLNASLAVAMVRSWEQHTVNQQQSQQQQETSQQDQGQPSTGSSTTDPRPAAARANGCDVQSAGGAEAGVRVQQLEAGVLPLSYCEGLRQASWPGRSQVVAHPKFMQPGSSSSRSRLTVYLDGAHTPESMVTCAQWFAQVTAQQQDQQQQQPEEQRQVLRVLIFNCMKERDPSVLLPELHRELLHQGAAMHVVLFVPPDSQYAFLPSSKTSALVAAVHQDLSWQQQLQQVWQQCEAAGSAGSTPAATAASDTAAVADLPALPEPPGIGRQDLAASNAAVLSCMADALGWLEQAAAAQPQLELQVLVSGSLYLVGDCLAGLQQQPS